MRARSPKKTCSSRFSLCKSVYLKFCWTQLETVHLRGPCRLKLCSSRPYTPHCWGHLVFLQPLPKIHTSNQYLKDLHWFGAIFKNLVKPFLRPLRSKDVQCWLLTLWPWKFVIISESLAANLEKVRQSFVWQTIAKFWFIWLRYLSFCITYMSKSLRNNKKDK